MSYPTLDITAPDSDKEVLCPGCNRLTLTVFNQQVYITFGHGLGMPLYDTPEIYGPTTGQLVRNFDSYKVRAYTPAAQLPSGVSQAHVQITPIPVGA